MAIVRKTLFFKAQAFTTPANGESLAACDSYTVVTKPSHNFFLFNRISFSNINNAVPLRT